MLDRIIFVCQNRFFNYKTDAIRNLMGVLLLSSLFLISGYSQDYEYIPMPDSGAIWSEMYYGAYGESEDEDQYERFTAIGEDTVVNSLKYTKVYVFYDSVFNKETATCIGGIREDSAKRIFFNGDGINYHMKPLHYNRDSNNEILLYDFSVNIGDSIWYGNWGDLLVVSDIDTVLIGGYYRRMISFESPPWVNWIEGIGNTKGLLFTSGDLPNDGTNSDLICFHLNDELLYFNDYYPDCYLISSSSVDLVFDNTNNLVFPNPAKNDLINILFEKSTTGTLSIYSTHGNLTDTRALTNQEELQINIEKYVSGIYYVVVTTESGAKVTGKFIRK